MLCIEIDENQHKGYIKTNELVRYDDLFMDFSGKYGKCKNPFLIQGWKC